MTFWSISNQTLQNWECLVIVDNHQMNRELILPKPAFTDPRFRIEINAGVGLASALNTGINRARSRYIARIDADDVMFPSRLHDQLLFLDSNPEVKVVGGQAVLIDARNTAMARQPIFPSDKLTIRKTLPRRNIIAHPAVTMCRETILSINGYREIFKGSEDFDLWLRVLNVGEIANLPSATIGLRKHEHNVSNNVNLTGLYSDLAQVCALSTSLGTGSTPTTFKDSHDGIKAAIRSMWRLIPINKRIRYYAFWFPASFKMKLSLNPIIMMFLSILNRFRPKPNQRTWECSWIALNLAWESDKHLWNLKR